MITTEHWIKFFESRIATLKEICIPYELGEMKIYCGYHVITGADLKKTGTFIVLKEETDILKRLLDLAKNKTLDDLLKEIDLIKQQLTNNTYKPYAVDSNNLDADNVNFLVNMLGRYVEIIVDEEDKKREKVRVKIEGFFDPKSNGFIHSYLVEPVSKKPKQGTWGYKLRGFTDKFGNIKKRLFRVYEDEEKDEYHTIRYNSIEELLKHYEQRDIIMVDHD